jgi:hypothetical protein
MAAALIDLILHYCHILSICGNSYWMLRRTELWYQLQEVPRSTSARRERQRG